MNGHAVAMGARALACFQARYDMRSNAQSILKILSELAPPPQP